MIISCVSAVPQKSVAVGISVKNNKVFFNPNSAEKSACYVAQG
jgi:hypothetical protein